MVTKKGRFGLSKRDSLLGMLSANRLLPMDKGNVLAKDGKIGDTLQSILEDLRPEAAYFADIEGARGGYLVVHMDDASQIPAFAEPLFLGLGATLHAQPVFTPEDMPRAMEALEAVRRPNPQPSRHRPAKYRLLTENP